MCKVFFFVALRWAPQPFGGARAKKNTIQGVFFCSGPGERQGKEKPVPARGQSKKKHHPGRPVGRRHGARAKKNTTQGVCFLLRPRGKAGKGEAPLGAGTGPEQKKKKTPGCFFFLLWPRAGAQRGFSFPCLSPGPQQKKHTLGDVLFFLLWPRAGTGLLLPLPFPGAGAKNKTPWVVFCSFCCGPARTLTHSLRAWVAMPPSRRGGVCFFLLRPRPDRGGVFFFAVAPPGRSLTHCGLGRFRQGPGGVCFFCCGPAGSF